MSNQKNEIPHFLQIAVSHHKNGRLNEAMDIYMRILKSHPDHPDANHLLGVLYHQTGQHETGLKLIRKAIRIRPDFAVYHLSLGNIFLDQKKPEKASLSYQKSIDLRPGYAQAYLNLGSAYDEMGRLDAAIACFQKAIESAPDFASAYNNLGNALTKKEKLDEALFFLNKAVELSPGLYEGFNNLGNALVKQLKLDEALEMFRRAVSLYPGYSKAYTNMANVYTLMGEQEKAIACYREALAADSGNYDAHTGLVFALNYLPDISPQEIYRESCEWARRHTSVPPCPRLKIQRKEAERKLRIGYVSADFNTHPVASFMLPVLEAHDRTKVEIFCYYSRQYYDEISRQCEALSDHWLQCEKMSDNALAERIRSDRIDILVDLSGHTAGNRLLVFARKPAPLQVSWLGDIATTGLKTMDYRLTSIDASPPGSENYFTEKLYRFTDHLWWCYRPQADMPDVQPSPAFANNCITFGYTNNFAKITPELIAIMIEILKKTPGSRLAMAGVPGGSARSALLAEFIDNGIGKERLVIHGKMALAAYWAFHSDIDIAFDSFSYNGGTTTCDALWLGVPVVTRMGETFASRMGYAIVKNIGLPELAAETWEEYVNIATSLADKREKLNNLRLSMRQRMINSPICDVPGFTKDLETAYGRMWKTWQG
ncbi:MAG: tetratricopeptide repeat protein [Desulfobulbaceae bacterium]|nr:tetratricopeptide repeat protein [Desulfobulbaceae bacterium]